MTRSRCTLEVLVRAMLTPMAARDFFGFSIDPFSSAPEETDPETGDEPRPAIRQRNNSRAGDRSETTEAVRHRRIRFRTAGS